MKEKKNAALTYAQRIRQSQSEKQEKDYVSQENQNLSVLLASLEQTDSDLTKELENLERLKGADYLDLRAINDSNNRIKGYANGKEGLKDLLTELFPNWKKELVDRYNSI